MGKSYGGGEFSSRGFLGFGRFDKGVWLGWFRGNNAGDWAFDESHDLGQGVGSEADGAGFVFGDGLVNAA